MRLNATHVAAALAAATLALAGCGDELADFRDDELRPLESQADEQKARLATSLKLVQPRDRGHTRLLKSQLEPLERTFGELAELDPPDDYDETYDRFVAANRGFSKRMRVFIAALKRGDENAMNAAGASAKEALGAAHRAIQPLYE